MSDTLKEQVIEGFRQINEALGDRNTTVIQMDQRIGGIEKSIVKIESLMQTTAELVTRIAVLEDRDVNNKSEIDYLKKQVDKFKWGIMGAYGSLMLAIVSYFVFGS